MQLDISALKQEDNSENITDVMKEFCRKSDIFAWVSDEIFEEIINNSHIVNYNTWDIIIKEWSESDGRAYFILEWEVLVTVESNIIANIWPWNIFWEYAIMCEEKRSATVKAYTLLKCLVINKDSLLLLANEDFKINNVLATRVEKNLDENVWGIFK